MDGNGFMGAMGLGGRIQYLSNEGVEPIDLYGVILHCRSGIYSPIAIDHVQLNML